MSEANNHSFSHPPQRSKSSMGSIGSRDESPDRKVTMNLKENAPNAYHTVDNRVDPRTELRKKYAFSVQQMIRSKSRKDQDFGIEGYWIPNFNAYMDKPRGRKWVNANLPDMFTEIKKRAQQTPSPDHYQK